MSDTVRTGEHGGSWAHAAERVVQTFGLGRPSGPMVWAAQGEQGVIWRLDTARGSFAVKELVVRQTEAGVAREVLFQEQVAAVATTYDVARTVRTTDGRVLAIVADRQIRVQSWLEMAPADPWLDPAAVGVLLAELHAAGDSRLDAVDDWYTAAVGEARWRELVVALDRRRSTIEPLIESVVPRLVQLESLLTRPANLRTCHRDLWADNVRTTSAGRICVFDWDNCGPADPSHELAMLVFEFGMGSDERIRSLYDAYVDAGGPGRIEGRGDLTMVVAQFGHFYAAAIEVFLDESASGADLEWARGRLDELEERPLTPDAVDQIVAACKAPNIRL